MLNITVICVGKLKERFYIAAVEEYRKRLKGCCKLELIELAEVRLPSAPSPAEISAALEKEAQAIEGKLPKQAAVIAMCIEGTLLSSEALAEQFRAGGIRCFSSGNPHWRLLRPASFCQKEGFPASVHVPDDLPSPFGPGNGFRTDLSGV